MQKHNVMLTAIGVYSYTTQDEEISRVEKKVRDVAFSHKYVRQLHGFYLTKEMKNIRFDLVISFAAENRQAVFAETVAHIQQEFPNYELQAAMDTDFSEE